VNMTVFVSQVIVGLVSGAGYAVVAVGISYTLGLARVMNFAYGTFYTIAAYLCMLSINYFGVPYLLAAAAAVVTVALLGLAFSYCVILPSMKVSDPTVMIATLGAGAAITSAAQWMFGADVAFVPSPFLNHSYRIAVASVTQQSLLIVVAAPVLTIGMALFMSHTVIGRRIVAVAEAPTLAAATGVNTPHVQALAATIGILLAAIASVLYSPTGVITVFAGDEVLLKSFAIAALAGIGRLQGALVTGLFIGLFEAMFSTFANLAYSTGATYALLVLTLIFFPRGLFRGY
jgi:branched-chain amino acid transport system permease protein